MTAPGLDPPLITSTSNPRVRAALALRERRGRSESGRLLVDGTREVLRAIEAGLTSVHAGRARASLCAHHLRAGDRDLASAQLDRAAAHLGSAARAPDSRARPPRGR